MNGSMKQCGCCFETKTINNFSKKSTIPLRYSSKCKTCHNKYVREVWYKKNSLKQIASNKRWRIKNEAKYVSQRLHISIEQAEAFVKAGKCKCEICGDTEKLHFDHCHSMGKVRGVLCLSCNTLIGRLGDTSEKVKNKTLAILKYLESSEKRNS